MSELPNYSLGSTGEMFNKLEYNQINTTYMNKAKAN